MKIGWYSKKQKLRVRTQITVIWSRKLIEPKLGEIDVMKLKKAYLEQLVLDLQEENMRIVPFILVACFENDSKEKMQCKTTIMRKWYITVILPFTVWNLKYTAWGRSACIKEYLLQKNDTYALGSSVVPKHRYQKLVNCGLKWEDIHLDTGIFEIKGLYRGFKMIITGKDFQKQCYISELQNRFHR